MAALATIATALLMTLLLGCAGGTPAPLLAPGPSEPLSTSQLLDTLRLEPLLTDRQFQSPTNLVQMQNERMLVSEQARPGLGAQRNGIRPRHRTSDSGTSPTA